MADTNGLDEARGAVEAAKSEFDRRYIDWVEAFLAGAVAAVLEQVKKEVVHDSEHTHSIGPDRVAALKAETRALAEAARAELASQIKPEDLTTASVESGHPGLAPLSLDRLRGGYLSPIEDRIGDLLARYEYEDWPGWRVTGHSRAWSGPELEAPGEGAAWRSLVSALEDYRSAQSRADRMAQELSRQRAEAAWDA